MRGTAHLIHSMDKSMCFRPGITSFQTGRSKTAVGQQICKQVTKSPHHLWGWSTQQHRKWSPCATSYPVSSSICNRTQDYYCSKARSWSAPTTQHSCRPAIFSSPQCQVEPIPPEALLKSHHRRCISNTELYCNQKFKCSTGCSAFFSFYKWGLAHLLEFIHNSSALCWYLPGTLRTAAEYAALNY